MVTAHATEPTHGRHWDLVRYERTPSLVKVAYVHRFTGKRVELTRPSAVRRKWQAELDRAPRRPAPPKAPVVPAEILGRIELPRRTHEIVADWHTKARDPEWIAWPTKRPNRTPRRR